MRPVVTVALLLALACLPAAPLRATEPTSKEQLHFGIEVAKRGLWAEARFRFERALALDPESVAALNNLAVACEQQGDFERAREAYEQALRLAPGNRQIRQNYDLFAEADEKRKSTDDANDGRTR